MTTTTNVQAMKKEAGTEQVGMNFASVQPSLFVPTGTTKTTTGYTLSHVYGDTFRTVDEHATYITWSTRQQCFVDAGDQSPAYWAGIPVGSDAHSRQVIRAACKDGAKDICIRFYALDLDVWMDAKAVADAGGPYAWVKWNCELPGHTMTAICNQDYEVIDDNGGIVGAFCHYGSGWGYCKWDAMADALEAAEESRLDEEVILAGLALGIPADEVQDAYMGEWEDDEAMAYDQWEQGGMLDSIPEAARGYIDWAMVARDMLMSGTTEANGHYFRQF